MSPRVAVIRFPGSNCEPESLQAVRRAGLAGEIVRWNQPVERIAGFDAYLLPGGFSYQDRIRAGAVAARLPLLDLLCQRAAEGAPLLGICNGAQILAEAGLIPGPTPIIRLALAPNRMERREGYYTRWIYLAPGPAAGDCLFTRGWRDPIPIPMAHAEGRFTALAAADREEIAARAAARYAGADGGRPDGFPEDPNGSVAFAAGVTNLEGNVLALMPHPERAQILAQVPERIAGPWGERRRAASGRDELEADGPGALFFHALARALRGGGR